MSKKYTAIIDDVEYNKKPVGESYSIVGRMINKGNQLYTLSEIAVAIEKGKTITPFKYETHKSGKIKGKKNEFFIGTNLIMLDIDEGLTIDEMLELHNDIGVQPNMYYTSFSHVPSHPKFRVVYCLPYMVRSKEEYKLIWDTLDKFYKEGTILDRTMDTSRMFFGSNTKPIIITEDPFNLGKLAYKMDTLISIEDDNIKIREAKLINPEIYNNLSEVSIEALQKSEMIQKFERGELNQEGDYHKIRSLMFVYYHLGLFDSFLKLAPLNKSKFTIEKWKLDLTNDIAAGRTGHTYTYQILKEIGAFEKVKSVQNEKVIVSNYLNARLDVLQCYKELGIPVKKYLPTNKIKEIIKLASQGHKILMIADTGTGKTHTTINAFKELQEKCIITVPNRMNAQQNSKIYQIGGAFAGSSLSNAMSNNDIVCAVWEMLQVQDLDYHKHILVNDEAHAHIHDSGYRGRSIRSVHRVMPRFKGVIDITATPTGLNLTQYTHIYQFVSEKQINYNVKLYLGFNETQRVVIANKAKGRLIWLENNKKNLYYYKALLTNESDTPDCVSIVTSDDKTDNPSFISIANKEKLLDNTKYLLCTSVLTAGVNILNKDITDIIIVGIKNVTTIKQFIARARQISNVNVHIFLIERKKDYYTFNIYEERRNEASILEKRARQIENDIERDLLDTEESLRRANLMRHSLDIEEDFQRMDEGIWRKYYNHLSISNFIVALKEFFSDIEVIEIEYEKDMNAKLFKESMLEQEENIDAINFDDLISPENGDKYSGIAKVLGYYESLQRGANHKTYKKLKKLYPNVNPQEVTQIYGIKELEKRIQEYGWYLSEGYSHDLSLDMANGEEDFGKISSQTSALLFMANKDKWKINSPAYIFYNTLVDKLPKNQLVSAKTMRDLCSTIEGRKFKEGDRFSNTIKEIKKVISIKKDRNTGMYNVGDWIIHKKLTPEVVSLCEKARIMESLDKKVRRARKITKIWLEVADKYKV